MHLDSFVGWRVIERNFQPCTLYSYLKGVDLQLNCVIKKKQCARVKDHRINVLLQNLFISASEFMFWPC